MLEHSGASARRPRPGARDDGGRAADRAARRPALGRRRDPAGRRRRLPRLAAAARRRRAGAPRRAGHPRRPLPDHVHVGHHRPPQGRGAHPRQHDLVVHQPGRSGFDFTPDERTLGLAPLFHIGGLNGTLNPTLLRGGCVVLVRGFDPPATLAVIAEQRVTSFFAVPTMLDAAEPAAGLRHPRPLGAAHHRRRRRAAPPPPAAHLARPRDHRAAGLRDDRVRARRHRCWTAPTRWPRSGRPGSRSSSSTSGWSGPTAPSATRTRSARWCSPGRTSWPATGTRPRRPRRRSSTAGTTPGTPARPTRTATSTSATATRT